MALRPNTLMDLDQSSLLHSVMLLQSFIHTLMVSHDLCFHGSYHAPEDLLGHGPRLHELMDGNHDG
ncbi:hypothetical protein DY000_02013605 [Brassica cretica]|uniref:Uncharacterized protein n=1 Tax=Brassica cretica TaxID=69181 RepID=A0ABQ7CU79_BRACR|nr:hypothetical protein DY000_02013605 [Brassica cretica]